MSRINQPSGQIKLTNVSIVRLRKGKKRFEIACYKNKVLEFRQGIEHDLDSVLQIDQVFVNVSKGQTAPNKDLEKAWGKGTTKEKIIEEILTKGEIQVGEDERKEQLERLRNEILDIVARNVVDPQTKKGYDPRIISEMLDQIMKIDGSAHSGSHAVGAGGVREADRSTEGTVASHQNKAATTTGAGAGKNTQSQTKSAPQPPQPLPSHQDSDSEDEDDIWNDKPGKKKGKGKAKQKKKQKKQQQQQQQQQQQNLNDGGDRNPETDVDSPEQQSDVECSITASKHGGKLKPKAGRRKGPLARQHGIKPLADIDSASEADTAVATIPNSEDERERHLAEKLDGLELSDPKQPHKTSLAARTSKYHVTSMASTSSPAPPQRQVVTLSPLSAPPVVAVTSSPTPASARANTNISAHTPAPSASKPTWTGVTTSKPAKAQALDAIRALIAHQLLPIMRVRLKVQISCPATVLAQKCPDNASSNSIDDIGSHDDGFPAAVTNQVTLRDRIMALVDEPLSMDGGPATSGVGNAGGDWEELVCYIDPGAHRQLEELLARRSRAAKLVVLGEAEQVAE